jgi:hypothetical protein
VVFCLRRIAWSEENVIAVVPIDGLVGSVEAQQYNMHDNNVHSTLSALAVASHSSSVTSTTPTASASSGARRPSTTSSLMDSTDKLVSQQQQQGATNVSTRLRKLMMASTNALSPASASSPNTQLAVAMGAGAGAIGSMPMTSSAMASSSATAGAAGSRAFGAPSSVSYVVIGSSYLLVGWSCWLVL